MSERAEERALLRDIEAAARARFGKHAKFRVYIDTSDGDEDDFSACLHYERRPADAKTDIMFPSGDRVFTTRKKLDALRQLLTALKGNVR